MKENLSGCFFLNTVYKLENLYYQYHQYCIITMPCIRPGAVGEADLDVSRRLRGIEVRQRVIGEARTGRCRGRSSCGSWYSRHHRLIRRPDDINNQRTATITYHCMKIRTHCNKFWYNLEQPNPLRLDNFFHHFKFFQT